MSGFNVFSTNQDLNTIFEPRVAQDPSALEVPYYTTSNQNLSARYYPYFSGNKAIPTGYECFDINGNLVDLSELYRRFATWNSMGTGVEPVGAPTVYAIAVLDARNVFVGGQFTSAGGVTGTSYIARWNAVDSSWNAMGTGLGPEGASIVFSIAVLDARNVFVGGQFSSASGVSTSYIARWNAIDSSWNAMGTGVTSNVTAIAVLDARNVFVGGSFLTASGVTGTRYIARWNEIDSSWNAMGTGVNSASVTAIAVLDSANVFVGGFFSSASGVSASRIARWNAIDSSWNAMGTGVDSIVRAIAVLDARNVFVGGGFLTAGGVSVSGIARWNAIDSSWNAMGAGVLSVNAIAVLDAANVFVGANFSSASGVSGSRIARWNANNSSWNAMGTSVGPTSKAVYAIAVLNATNVFVGGDFTRAGDVSRNYVAVWG